MKSEPKTVRWLVVFGVAAMFLSPAGRIGSGLTLPAGAALPERGYSRQHVIVELSPEAIPAAVVGAGSERVMGNWRTVPVPAGDTPEGLASRLAGRRGVEHVEFDYLVELDPGTDASIASTLGTLDIDDPLAIYQWHFPLVQAEEAWNTSAGGGVVVAVVDSGISQEGEDLDCQSFVAPYNAITQQSGLSAASDDEGHGTHVAGTIAQCTNNGIGVAGVAHDAVLMPVKVLDNTGSGLMSWIARGVDWARVNGADVINLSLGCSVCSSALLDEAIDAAIDQGVVVVAASGNANASSVFYPASHPDVIAVGASTYDNERAPYSNRGSALEFVAPGGNTDQDLNGDGFADGVLQETFTAQLGWGYHFFQGTSMATPHVSSAAAILKSLAPALDTDGVRTVLEATALDLGPAGFDSEFGSGLIQIADAIAYLTAPDSTPPAWGPGARLTVGSGSDGAVLLSWPTATDDRGVAEYRVYLDGSLIATGSETHHEVTGLAAGALHSVDVRAVDLAGNTSPPLSASFTTLDVTPPVWTEDAEMGVTEFGERQVTLQWTEAHDDVAVSEYRVGLTGTGGVLTGAFRAELTGLQPGTSYTIEITASDAAGNWSPALTGNVRTSRQFFDTPGTTFYDDILWMSGIDITRGCNPPVNDLFCPDDPVTRGQLAAFFVRALGLSGDTHPGFVDVPSSSTFASDIGKLATAGITLGCNPPVNDLFCPDDPVTRGQLAAFFNRALGRS